MLYFLLYAVEIFLRVFELYGYFLFYIAYEIREMLVHNR